MYYYELTFLKTLGTFARIIVDWIWLGISVRVGLAWDAALQISKFQLEYLSDPDMLR